MNWPQTTAPMLGGGSNSADLEPAGSSSTPRSVGEHDAAKPNSGGDGAALSAPQTPASAAGLMANPSWQQQQPEGVKGGGSSSTPRGGSTGGASDFRGLVIASPQHYQQHYQQHPLGGGDGLSPSTLLSPEASNSLGGAGGGAPGSSSLSAAAAAASASLQQHMQAQELLLMMSAGGSNSGGGGGGSGSRSPPVNVDLSPPRLSPAGSLGGGPTHEQDLLSLLQQNLRESLAAAAAAGGGGTVQQQYEAARSAELFRLHYGAPGSPPNLDFSSGPHSGVIQVGGPQSVDPQSLTPQPARTPVTRQPARTSVTPHYSSPLSLAIPARVSHGPPMQLGFISALSLITNPSSLLTPYSPLITP